jgi:ATP-dependent DNA helicase PIF1
MSFRSQQTKFTKPRLEKGQSTIASFFLSKNGSTTVKTDSSVVVLSLPGGFAKSYNPLSRHNSVLNNVILVEDEFDDNESPDTSFEVENFLQPKLNGCLNQPGSGANGTKRAKPGDILSSRLTKRLDFLNESFGGQPRKIQRVTSPKLQESLSVSRSGDTELSQEQNAVIEAVVISRRNIFYTGSAGTGKSVVLRKLVKKLQHVYGDKVGITASTGMAACNISGSTVHKFLGIGIGQGSAFEISKRIKRNQMVMRRWQSLKVLIIDEISMIDGILFDKVNEIAKLLRGNRKPFGGIQLVCTGDFFQLPPVCKDGRPKYCFQADSWNEVIDEKIVLTKVFRQKGDDELISMLNALRKGRLDDQITMKFKKLARRVTYTDGIEPTELFPTRNEVKISNLSRLNQLKGRTRTFMAKDYAPANTRPEALKQLDNLMCDKQLALKEGAQVMYLKNNSELIVNGSIGTVMYFLTKELWIKVLEYYKDFEMDDPKIVEEIRLLSRRIASTADWSDADKQAFERIPEDRRSVFHKLCQMAGNSADSDVLPVVVFKFDTFSIPLLVEEFDFTVENGTRSDDKLMRTQLPLILSWAMSIHKAQGQTIDRLRIDLTKSFEMGQIYVALSRATNTNHLEVKNFEPYKVKVSEDVIKFYNE